MYLWVNGGQGEFCCCEIGNSGVEVLIYLKWMERLWSCSCVCVALVIGSCGFVNNFFLVNKNAYFVFSFELINLHCLQNLLISVSFRFIIHYLYNSKIFQQFTATASLIKLGLNT